MIYVTKDGKVYRFTPDRWSRFLYNYSMRGEMPDLEKSGKLVGEGVVSMDGWTVEDARDALIKIMGRIPINEVTIGETAGPATTYDLRGRLE